MPEPEGRMRKQYATRSVKSVFAFGTQAEGILFFKFCLMFFRLLHFIFQFSPSVSPFFHLFPLSTYTKNIYKNLSMGKNKSNLVI